MRSKPAWRELLQEEKEIIDILLAQDFPRRDAIKEQIANALVRSRNCGCGCLTIEFSTGSVTTISTKQRVPVEASYSKYGRPFQILLHIWEGKVSELGVVSYSDIVDSEYPKDKDLEIKINEQ